MDFPNVEDTDEWTKSDDMPNVLDMRIHDAETMP